MSGAEGDEGVLGVCCFTSALRHRTVLRHGEWGGMTPRIIAAMRATRQPEAEQGLGQGATCGVRPLASKAKHFDVGIRRGIRVPGLAPRLASLVQAVCQNGPDSYSTGFSPAVGLADRLPGGDLAIVF